MLYFGGDTPPEVTVRAPLSFSIARKKLSAPLDHLGLIRSCLVPGTLVLKAHWGRFARPVTTSRARIPSWPGGPTPLCPPPCSRRRSSPPGRGFKSLSIILSMSPIPL